MTTRLFYDLSMPLSDETPCYPGNPEFNATVALALSRGDDANVTALRLGTHTGTHVDAPLHFSDSGYDVTQIPFDQLIGPAQVVQIEGDMITLEEMQTKTIRHPRLLFKTKNTALGRLRKMKYDPNYVALRPEAAKYLLNQRVITFGIDYLSIEMPGDKQDYEKGLTHRQILSAGRTIIEGCDLTDVPVGDYNLMCLPLRISRGNGAPARTLLEKL